jgi:hypothetical protein
MKPRAELGLAAATFVVVLAFVAVIGARAGTPEGGDLRRSTYLSGPAGASGLTDALARLGVRVLRVRQNPAWLAHDSSGEGGGVLAVIGPADALSAAEGIALATGAASNVDLLLAGPGAAAAMRCFGWRVRPRIKTAPAAISGAPGDSIAVRAVLTRARRSAYADSAGAEDGEVAECKVPLPVHADTLLVTEGGTPAAIRLELPGGRTVTLVADDALFSNRQLRETAAGPFALGLVVERYRTFTVDEYHQGYGPSGSLAGAVLRWSRESPWGWAGWQLAAVGLLALVATGRRLGPARAGIERRRRSPLEHVRALATALAAARGHDVAVTLLVQGLRRRLARGTEGPPGRALRGDPGSWLAGIARRTRTPRGRAAAEELLVLTSQPQPPEGVLRAADLVEDLWMDLTPSRSPTT